MILIAGGTGLLGRELVRELGTRPLRVFSRSTGGDVRDRASVREAMQGVRTVISAVHGFVGKGVSPASIDVAGNENLIAEARAAGVDRFILLSVYGASADHPMSLFRAKFTAEQALIASGLRHTIVRPTAFVETWLKILGEPLLAKGKTTIFGVGRNPINFVSVADVARVVAEAVDDTESRVVDVAGPANVSFNELVETFARVTGARGGTKHVPRTVMRASAWLTRPFSASLSRMIRAGVVMDTCDFTCTAASPFPQTSVEEAIRRVYGTV
jgi:uncharacterized protein YbjT (DUF2867 family)